MRAHKTLKFTIQSRHCCPQHVSRRTRSARPTQDMRGALTNPLHDTRYSAALRVGDYHRSICALHKPFRALPDNGSCPGMERHNAICLQRPHNSDMEDVNGRSALASEVLRTDGYQKAIGAPTRACASLGQLGAGMDRRPIRAHEPRYPTLVSLRNEHVAIETLPPSDKSAPLVRKAFQVGVTCMHCVTNSGHQREIRDKHDWSRHRCRDEPSRYPPRACQTASSRHPGVY